MPWIDGTNSVADARFMSSDSSVPQEVRSKYANDWGLCGDEFPDTGHMSPQLYIREARRLVGETVFTQNSALDKAPRGNESIGMGCCENPATIYLRDYSVEIIYGYRSAH